MEERVIKKTPWLVPIISGAHAVFFHCPVPASFIRISSISCDRLCYNPGLCQLRWRDGSFNLLGSGPVTGVWIALVHILIIFMPSHEFFKWEIPWWAPGSFSLGWQLHCSIEAAKETSYSKPQGTSSSIRVLAQRRMHVRARTGTGTHCLIHYFSHPPFTY